MSNALATLILLADEAKAIRYPNTPYRVKCKYSDKDANSLTTAIVDYINLTGNFATRLQSTGTFRADLQKFVPSQQRSGLPDVMAVIDGQALYVEVKFGKDRLSDDQKEAIAALQKAGASVYIAQNFQSFFDWFAERFLTAPFA